MKSRDEKMKDFMDALDEFVSDKIQAAQPSDGYAESIPMGAQNLREALEALFKTNAP